MLLNEKMKGISLTFIGIIVALMFITILIGTYFLVQKYFFEVHVIVRENELERKSIILAENLLSSPRFVEYPVKDSNVLVGYPYNKGVVNATLLDRWVEMGYASRVTSKADLENLNWQQLFQNARTWEIGYPNTFSIVYVVDLDNCDKNSKFCKGWIFALKGPTSFPSEKIKKFLTCLATNWNVENPIEVISAIFGLSHFLSNPLVSSLFIENVWTPFRVAECINNAFGSNTYFSQSSTQLSSLGLPVLISYGNDLHIGRLVVGIVEWG